MVSRITRIDLPSLDEDDQVPGWDSTALEDCHQYHDNDTLHSLGSSIALAAVSSRQKSWSLSSHALAHEQLVCGLVNDDETTKISWKTSLAPHRVCQVASNPSGNLIAVTLDNGNLSILRGSDGRVLATRRVVAEGVRGAAAFVEFVQPVYTKTAPATTEGESLLMVPPEGLPLLVSNMQGGALNSDQQAILAEATNAMGFHALRLQDCEDIRALRGFARRITPTASREGEDEHAKDRMVIRLAAVDGDGRLSIHDYDLQTKKAAVVNADVSLEQPDGAWEVDLEVGLRVQVVPRETEKVKIYLYFSLFSGHRTRICWLDLETLVIAGEYNISKNAQGITVQQTPAQRIRILAMESVESCEPSKALALLITVKFPCCEDKVHQETQLLQAILKDDKIENCHSVYIIPVPPSVQALAVAARPGCPYSFLVKTWSEDAQQDCHVFRTPMEKNDNTSLSATIGRIRFLCANQQYNEAQDMLIKSPNEIIEALAKDPFARFHSSEIAVKQLIGIMESSIDPMADPKNKMAIQIGLRQLVQGASTGNSLAQKSFLKIAAFMQHWPGVHKELTRHRPPAETPLEKLIQDFLAGMISAMKTVQDAFDIDSNSSLSREFKQRMMTLQERHSALSYFLDQIYPTMKISGALDENSSADRPFSKVQDFPSLFATLIERNRFEEAEAFARMHLRTKLSADSMTMAILKISPNVNPREYAYLLTDTILPSLSIGHELLPVILSWACRTAEAFDDAGSAEGQRHTTTLDDAIFLLESMERCTKDLRLRLHGSFAIYSPFVDNLVPKRRKLNVGNSMSSRLDISLSSTDEHDARPKTGDAGSKISDDWQRPNPTILEQAHLKGGAQKRRHAVSLDAVDETEDIVEFKLSSARCLKQARSLGLPRDMMNLRNFADIGGVQAVAKALVRRFSESSTSHEDRLKNLCQIVQEFCQSTGSDFDGALISHVKDLCGGKTTTKRKIEEATSIARCASSVGTKCQITLITLRAALFCRFSPKWLSDLSQEAIGWAAGDSSLRSELEEASRLLLIDGIVGRYCGEGAKELFHVDNPRHALRLLEFVTQHFEGESALKDSLDLCDAFAHLSREDACSRILENAILRGDALHASRLLADLYKRNSLLAQATFSRVIPFCIDLINDTALTSTEGEGTLGHCQVVSCAHSLASIALLNVHSTLSSHEGFSGTKFNESALDNLVADLKRLQTLQQEHSTRLPFSALQSPRALVKVISNMLVPVVESYLSGHPGASNTKVTQIKRACALLSGCCNLDISDLYHSAVGASACRLAMKSKDQECINFMSDVGILEAAHNNLAARSCIAVALSFCLKASKMSGGVALEAMKHVVMAQSLLKDSVLLKCPPDLVGKSTAVSEICNIVVQVLVRADEGVGENLENFRKSMIQRVRGTSCETSNDLVVPSLRRGSLHPTWYVGDGLLLPPAESLQHSLDYCQHALRSPARPDSVLDLHAFVYSRGAYALGLRLLASTVASMLSSHSDAGQLLGIQDAGKNVVLSLAERYIGGTSTGITSGLIDSQMAVAFLLCLPLKTSFGVYKSSLPTAISTRDFPRVLTLANVGIAAGSGKIFPFKGQPLQHWARQRKFVVQCREIALRAKWWRILQENHVQFDTNRFQSSVQSSAEHTASSAKYIESLLPPLIVNLARKKKIFGDVYDVVAAFSDAFGLQRRVPVEKCLSFVLSSPEGYSVTDCRKSLDSDIKEDIRMKLSQLDSTARSLLRKLECPIDRASILRDCLVQMEAENNLVDYERLSVVLDLYQTELSAFLHTLPEKDISRGKIAEQELIDRRRDVLAIVSWYFQDDLYNERPSFSDFFMTLPKSWDEDPGMNARQCILPVVVLQNDARTYFDPIRPLENILQSSKGVAAASALDPLCLPLGIPRGFIHARCLTLRFDNAKRFQAPLPTFEDDVLPILNRLKISKDVAELALWCSSQYRFEDEDKLRCLDHSLIFAMKASAECESKSSRVKEDEIVQEINLSAALERVKRITHAKDVLSDRLAVNAILKSVETDEDKTTSFGETIKELMSALDEKVWSQLAEVVPEKFVEIFIEEASIIASEACRDQRKALSIGQLRELSKLVYRASASLADKYSHVQVNGIARRLIRRWLFHGDQITSLSDCLSSAVTQTPAKVDDRVLQDIEEEDTINFVMDLNAIQQSNDIAACEFSREETKVTSEEEPRLLCFTGSPREVSDSLSQRSSLRIAFLMSFTEDTVTSDYASMSANNENSVPQQNSKVKPGRIRSKLSGRGSKRDNDIVSEHGRELLRVVFAKTAPSSWVFRDHDASMESRSLPASSGKSKQPITFAMRYRALRVASILCPQQVLQQIIEEEDLISDPRSTLSKTAFAAFIAKEIEEMGLPLPHSDIGHLSTMHFPSFARTLWRHHRDDKCCKGRLLLLVLEMYLKENVKDFGFITSIVSEMKKSSLPRSLLMSFERIESHVHHVGMEQSAKFLQEVGEELCFHFEWLCERFIIELRSTMELKSIESGEYHGIEATVSTLRPIGAILSTLSAVESGRSLIKTFLQSLVSLPSIPITSLPRDVFTIFQRLQRQLPSTDQEQRKISGFIGRSVSQEAPADDKVLSEILELA